MAADETPTKDPSATKQRQPTWVVWLLLALVAGFAVFTATRERAPGHGSARASRSAAAAQARAPRPAASAPAGEVITATTPAVLLSQGCPGAQAAECGCREKVVERALTLGAPDSALLLVSGSAEPCRAGARMQGLQAEALARSGSVVEALALLPALEKLEPANASAPYVRAIAALKRGNSPEAAKEATLAIDRGRGAPAHVARALAFFQDAELDPAEASLKRALKAAPEDVDALYNLAVIEQRRNRYTDARTGYLRVLRLRPDHLDARLNVALLTLGAGALEEARHHQRKLLGQAPAGDPRVAKLAAALDKAPLEPAPVVRAAKQ